MFVENRVDVIMPAFNAEKTIKRAIDSILAQTYKNWRLIVIDDGSVDNTFNIVKSIQDSRIECYKQENRGPAEARNSGLAYSNGKYIAFIDSDDIVCPQYLSVLINTLEKNNSDVSMCLYKKILVDEKEDYAKIIKDNVVDIKADTLNMDADESIKQMFYKKKIMPYPFLKLFKREIIGDVKFPSNLRLGEDLEFNLNILKKCQKISVVDVCLYFHIENKNSITHNIKYDIANEHFKQLVGLLSQEVKYRKSIIARIFIVSYDFLCQAEKKDIHNKELYRLCLKFIKENKKNVLKDKNCSKVVRVLATISFFSISCSVNICRVVKRMNLKRAI